MNVKIKLGAYAVLILLAAWFAWGFHSNYATVSRETAEAATNDIPAVVATNTPDATNSSNMADSSNAVATATNAEVTTSAPPAITNTKASSPPAHAVQGTMIGYLAAFIAAVVGLGLMIAYDVTQYLGSAAVDALLDDKGEGMRDPEYERAEQAWANGKHLEAIEMMRDFLKTHPREQYAALRIAEIYEKDLGNPLAAALEYEEVLKKKLPAERWGWAAVHLCNLYSKLGQQDKTRALLQRIVDEYPKTGAAKKARNRLGLPEPEIEKSAGPAGEELLEEPGESTPPPAAPQSASETPEPPKSNLPPGFRPKS